MIHFFFITLASNQIPNFICWSLKCVSNLDVFSHSNGIALILLLATSLQWSPGPSLDCRAGVHCYMLMNFLSWLSNNCQLVINHELWIIHKHYKLGIGFFILFFPLYQNITILFCPICPPQWYQNSLPTKNGNATAQWDRKSYLYKCKNLIEILVKEESDFNIFISQNITDQYTEKVVSSYKFLDSLKWYSLLSWRSSWQIHLQGGWKFFCKTDLFNSPFSHDQESWIKISTCPVSYQLINIS